MRITDLLPKSAIELGLKPMSKEEAIRHLADLMEKAGNLSDTEQYLSDVLAREASGTTGLGMGIATPHAKSKGVKAAGLAAMTVPEGLDFESLDGAPSQLFFMIAAPEGAADTHVELLSRLATLLIDPDFKEALLQAKTADDFLQLIDDKENDRFTAPVAKEERTEVPQEVPPSDTDVNTSIAKDVTDNLKDETKQSESPVQKSSTPSKYPRILAVTACPTGIAHTYMAAESLERTAKAMGINIKVEKNGSSGIKDKLTAEEIAHAECIIVAADKQVAMARFNGKPMIQVPVAAGINKAKELLTKAISEDTKVYHAAGADGSDDISSAEEMASDPIIRQIYKHLMNGVSHMLPFIIGGGILMAIAFLIDPFNPADPAAFGTGTPLAKMFMTIGKASFQFMLPVLSGFIAMSIGDRPALAAGFVGGYLTNEGGAGFLGALLTGFIAGYLMLGLKKAFSRMPKTLEGIKPVLIYPVLGVLIMGIITLYCINPPVGALNAWLIHSLSHLNMGSRILIGAVMGGMMSVDMGGPVNKAAYVIATGLLASGQYDIMASVMAGGMVPPLAIALCTTFFKNRFTNEECKAGLSCYAMGLSFITEGAIPFAASDPIRVIPSCIIGSAVAGGLSMAFNCGLPAPHGGIFVVPIVQNPWMYLIAIAVGSVVSCLALALAKKPLPAELRNKKSTGPQLF